MILAATLPDNAGYVAAAYLVFFALVVIYLAIMAAKLSRLERELGELNELADDLVERRRPAEPDAVGAAGEVTT
jgi:CcmD family protein